MSRHGEHIFVRRDERQPGIYIVRPPHEASHYVEVFKENGQDRSYCTCSPGEEAEPPDCLHAQAVRRHVEERRKTALARRERGVEYIGNKTNGASFVWVREGGKPSELSPKPSQRLFNHSPLGFAWGYEGSGPAQLALAILLDFTGDSEAALRHYQVFKRTTITKIPQSVVTWRMTGRKIEEFLDRNAA